MKASKALKRLAKIEGLLADVMDRYEAANAQGPLGEAKSAIARAKEAVSIKPPASKKKVAAEKPKKKATAVSA